MQGCYGCLGEYKRIYACEPGDLKIMSQGFNKRGGLRDTLLAERITVNQFYN